MHTTFNTILLQSSPMFNVAVDWVLLGTLFTAIAAFISSCLLVYDLRKSPIVNTKLTDFAFSPDFSINTLDMNGQPVSLTGQQYFIGILVQTTRKQFVFKELDVEIRQGNGAWIKGKPYWANRSSFGFDDGVYDLQIPKGDFLPFNGLFPVDSSLKKYLTFFVEGGSPAANTPEIRLTFTRLNGKKVRFALEPAKMDFLTAVFDEDLWFKQA